MKLHALLAATLVTALTAGCATAPTAGLEAGKFVRYDCNPGRDFSARVSEDGKSLRIRAHEGSAELDAAGDGTFKGEGYVFVPEGEKGIALQHNGKWVGERCKKEA
jgi:hypothetical protein